MENKNILFIEDEKDIRDIYKLKLENEGYDVKLASDGKEGLEVFKNNKEEIDLILLDLMMPEMSGFDFLKKIKDQKKNSPPVIVLSNVNQERDIQEAIKLKAKKFLVKSHYNPEELVEKIDEFFSSQNE